MFEITQKMLCFSWKVIFIYHQGCHKDRIQLWTNTWNYLVNKLVKIWLIHIHMCAGSAGPHVKIHKVLHFSDQFRRIRQIFFSITQCQLLFANPVYYLCLQAWPPTAILGEPKLQPCFPPRHDPSASRFLSHDSWDFHQGKRSTWEESRYPQYFESCPLCALLISWRRYSAHNFAYLLWIWGSYRNPLGTRGEHANSTQKHPFRRPHPRYGHRQRPCGKT